MIFGHFRCQNKSENDHKYIKITRQVKVEDVLVICK